MAVAKATFGQINKSHRHCFACGSDNDSGLGLVFKRCGDDCVRAECAIDDCYQGYPGVVQGGIIATILDCAMTNCLFAMGVEAMTARLNVQFHKPVLIGEDITVQSALVERRDRVYSLKASISQCGQIRASASARFMEIGDTRI